MAKKASSRRKRRTPEEMIADLQRKIEEVKARAQAQSVKESPCMKRTISILRSIAKGMDEAKEEGNGALRHALADAHRILSGYLESQGLRPPKARMPRGRRPSAGQPD